MKLAAHTARALKAARGPTTMPRRLLAGRSEHAGHGPGPDHHDDASAKEAAAPGHLPVEEAGQPEGTARSSRFRFLTRTLLF